MTGTARYASINNHLGIDYVLLLIIIIIIIRGDGMI
jgi:hypothetical protein